VFHADFIEKPPGRGGAGRLDVEGTVSGFDENKAKRASPLHRAPFMIVGKLRHGRRSESKTFSFVKRTTQRTASRRFRRPPCCCAAAGGGDYEAYRPRGVLRRHRPSLPEELRQLGEAGCR